MNYKDYKRIKEGNYQSVGMFGDNIYAYEVLTGFADIPGYYQITKEEFETYDESGERSIGMLHRYDCRSGKGYGWSRIY